MTTPKSTSSFSRGGLWTLALLTALFSASCAHRDTAPASAWVGSWSAPSLSRPEVPIHIVLFKEGTATEQVGDYRGSGSWRPIANAVRIDWDSQWVGILRPDSGRILLATWKAGSPTDGPPDDLQPAQRTR